MTSGRDNDSALRRAAWWLLAFTVLFMVYASLYPFDFDASRIRALSTDHLLQRITWRRPPRSDLIANLLFYMPFGVLVTYLAPVRWPALKCWVFTVAMGTTLSIVIESLQFTTTARDPAFMDVVLNSASTGLASLLTLAGRGLGLRPALPQLRTARADRVALLLGILWIAFHAAPLMPTNRFVRYLGEPQLLIQWDLSLASAAGFFAGYVIMGVALRSLLSPKSFLPVLATVTLVSLLARIIFRGQVLEVNEIFGLLAALPFMWAGPLYAGLVVAAALVFFLLAPFAFVARSPDFDWLGIPDLIRRNRGLEPGLFELLFLYVGCVWLVNEARLPIFRALMWIVGTGLVIEVAQAWQPGKTAQLAGPAAAVAAAVLIRIGASLRKKGPAAS